MLPDVRLSTPLDATTTVNGGSAPLATAMTTPALAARRPVATPSAVPRRRGWLAERLSRVTSSEPLIPEIDGLRFVAILGVIVFHTMSVYLPVSGRSDQVQTWAQWMSITRLSWLIAPAYCGRF